MTENVFTPPEVLASEEQMENGKFFEKMGVIMRDKGFLVDAAFECDKAYRDSEIARLTGEGKPVEDWLNAPLFNSEEKRVLVSGAAEGNDVEKSVYDKAQQKLAMGLAGFYALSEGLGIMTDNNPGNKFQAQDSLENIVNGTESESDRNVMSRLAHATWAAGQPFRNRETRAIMAPWDTLPTQEKHKDMIQIKAAAQVLKTKLSSTQSENK